MPNGRDNSDWSGSFSDRVIVKRHRAVRVVFFSGKKKPLGAWCFLIKRGLGRIARLGKATGGKQQFSLFMVYGRGCCFGVIVCRRCFFLTNYRRFDYREYLHLGPRGGCSVAKEPSLA